MFYSQERHEIRKMYFNAWQKHQQNLPREPLEDIIINVILMHPEYHAALEQSEKTEDKDYTPEMGESNPFLHMGLHIAIHEQLSTDQPAGIKSAYQQLVLKIQDAHEVEHRMMECLAETLYKAQRDNTIPDLQAYLQRLKKI